MLNIFTLKVGDKYSAQYVNNLFRSLVINAPTSKFHFYCMTDDTTDLDPIIRTMSLPDNPRVNKQWFKLYFHDMHQFAGQKCLILDIDYLILSDMKEIIEWDLPPKHFGCHRRWWSELTNICEISGGFQMFYQGETWILLHTFLMQPEYYQKKYIDLGWVRGPVNGEQNFVNEFVGLDRSWLPEKWFAKYYRNEIEHINSMWLKTGEEEDYYFFDGQFDSRIKMVHFSDANNMIHQQSEKWITKLWNNQQL